MAVNPSLLPLFMAFGTRDRERRRRLTQTMLPLAMPVAPAMRTAVAAFTIDREVHRSQRESDQIARDAEAALQTVYDSGGAKLTSQELAELPALAKAFTKLNLHEKVVQGGKALGVAADEVPALREAINQLNETLREAMKWNAKWGRPKDA